MINDYRTRSNVPAVKNESLGEKAVDFCSLPSPKEGDRARNWKMAGTYAAMGVAHLGLSTVGLSGIVTAADVAIGVGSAAVAIGDNNPNTKAHARMTAVTSGANLVLSSIPFVGGLYYFGAALRSAAGAAIGR